MTAPTGGPGGGAATPAKTTSGGCLKGCLFGCLGLTVVLLIAAGGVWYGWHRWGRPWLNRKEQAVARYVPKGLLPGKGGSGAGPLSSIASQLTGGRLSPKLPATAGKITRAALPHDLWVPAAKGPAAYDTQPDGDAASVVRVRGASMKALAARARRQMRHRGWTLVRSGKDGDGTALLFRRHGARARIGLYPRDGAIEVWSRRSPSGSGPTPGSGGRSGRSPRGRRPSPAPGGRSG